jgi:predicted secreted hydrolase
VSLMRAAWSMLLACASLWIVNAEAVEYSRATPGYSISFPRDEGAHPAYRTEWWYVTGWIEDGTGVARGFQVTFFRSRPGTDEGNPSAFAAKQLLFAHAAVSDPRRGRLLREEKAAREGFGLAAAREGDLDVFIDAWYLRRQPRTESLYRAKVASREFELDLVLQAVQPPLLQGQQGFSQKQPDARFASHYYSLPQLQVTGSLVIERRTHRVRGVAWLDHEWSSAIMDERSQGWDWVGVNFADGSALMAFQVRDLQGKRQWAAATVRSADGSTRTYRPEDVDWQPQRRWRSPRTGIVYPVAWRVRVGERSVLLQPLMDDQENDARGSTGTLYWEGAVTAADASGRALGRGYLELTGYAGPVRF